MFLNSTKILLCTLLFYSTTLIGQDTFSIVAVDEETGEIGSAGASCVQGAADIGGVIIISDIIPGRGAINGQATICIPHVNLENGIDRMREGLAPQAILDWLYTGDACLFGDRESRQYGIVDFSPEGEARSAAFTGSSALSYAGHRVGPNYAIQGNILLGPEILDSMESRFLRTTGSLADRLMAAMQGANVPGADSRCLAAGTSSTSAFLQVYRPDDAENDPYLRLNVAETQTGVEPIDSLQALFDAWLVTDVDQIAASPIQIYPNPTTDWIQLENPTNETLLFNLYSLDGKELAEYRLPSGNQRIDITDLAGSGLVIYQLRDKNGFIQKVGKLLIL